MERGLQIHIQCPIHELFDKLIRTRRPVCQPLRQGPGRPIKLCQGNAAIDQSNALSLCATDILCQQRHLQGSAQAYQTRQRVTAAAVRNQANACEAFAQASILSRDAHVTRQGDVQGDTSCYALNCSDDWFGHVKDRRNQAMVLRQLFAHQVRFTTGMSRPELCEVLTSPKCSPGASEHDAADHIIVSSCFDSFYELL